MSREQPQLALPGQVGQQGPPSLDRLHELYRDRLRVPCRWCGAEAAEGSTCPKSLRCPVCSVRPGVRCKRPSEHDAPMHAARWEAAEALDVAAGP